MRFRIYYGDGSTYSDQDGSPFYAPTANAQAVVGENGKPAYGKSSFYFKNDEWHNCDELGLWDYIFNHRGPKAMLVGRTIRNETFWKIVGRATREGLG